MNPDPDKMRLLAIDHLWKHDVKFRLYQTIIRSLNDANPDHKKELATVRRLISTAINKQINMSYTKFWTEK